MTREIMAEKLKTLGIEEPSKDQISAFMDSFNGEMKAKDAEIESLKAASGKTDEMKKQMESLQSALDASNEKIKTFESSLAEKDTKIKDYEVSGIKHRVAHEMGLSYDAVSFIQGADEDSIKASAESLKSLVGVNRVPAFDQEPKVEKDERKASIRALAKSLSNR